MAKDGTRYRSSLSRAVDFIFLSWFTTAFLCIGFLSYAGYAFLPSRQWVLAFDGYGLLPGLMGSASCALAALAHKPPTTTALKKIAAVLLVPLLGFILGQATPTAVVPVIWSIVAGSQVGQVHVVESADGASSRRCGYSIKLRDLPFGFDRICHVPISARSGVAAGDQIVVQGYGTSYGVYASRWWRLE